MKKTFLFLLLACALVSNAQNVLIKDSSFVLLNGILTDAPLVQSYTYNTDCRVSSQNNSFGPSFYTYYSNGNLYQHIFQHFNQAINMYINDRRSTYIYTSSNKLSSFTTEVWDVASGLYINQTKDSSVYDEHDYIIKYLSYTWDVSTNTWIISSDRVYYNESNGLTDSSITYNHTSNTTTEKTYYTYYTGSTKLKVDLSDYYDSTNTLYFSLRYSYFYDSANYVKTDSLYGEYKNPSDEAFTPYSATTTKITYNTDGTIEVFNYTDKFLNTAFTYNNIIYNFYAPCSEALPATLLSFSGEQKNNNAVLHWQTANEINTAYFTILRSTDAVNFTTIGKVRATGNSSVQKDYTYTDANINLLNTTKVYYKLAVTSNDGKIAYSKIVPLSVAAGKLYVFVSPNPFTNSITVNVPEALHDAKVTISDMNGKILYTAAQSTLSGTLRIDASRFTKGIYVITIRSAADKQVFKIVK